MPHDWIWLKTLTLPQCPNGEYPGPETCVDPIYNGYADAYKADHEYFAGLTHDAQLNYQIQVGHALDVFYLTGDCAALANTVNALHTQTAADIADWYAQENQSFMQNLLAMRADLLANCCGNE